MKHPVWINVGLFPVKTNLCWNDAKPQYCWASPLPGGSCWQVVFCWVIYVTHQWIPQSSLNAHNCNFNRWIWQPLSVKSWAKSHFNPGLLPLSPPRPFGTFMLRCLGALAQIKGGRGEEFSRSKLQMKGCEIFDQKAFWIYGCSKQMQIFFIILFLNHDNLCIVLV